MLVLRGRTGIDEVTQSARLYGHDSAAGLTLLVLYMQSNPQAARRNFAGGSDEASSRRSRRFSRRRNARNPKSEIRNKSK
jgi:hypothetical protein